MSNFLNQFPYSDFHELNLDWILKEIKRLANEMQDYEAANTVEYDGIWDITTQYEKWSVVLDDHSHWMYISRQPVPSGIQITNTEYWTLISPFAIDTSLSDESYNAIANKTVTEAINELSDSVDQRFTELGDSVDQRFTDVNSAIVDEISNRAAEDVALSDRIITNRDAIALNSTNIQNLNHDLSSEAETRTTQDALLSARIDNIAHLPSGSTSGDAELIDIRTGADGTVYPNAGDAVRDQIEAVTDKIDQVKDVTTITKSEYRDVDITNSLTLTTGFVDKNGNVYTGEEYANYRYTNKIDVLPGDKLKSDWFRVITAFIDNEAVEEESVYNTREYTVPDGVTQVIITIPTTTTRIIQNKEFIWMELICQEDLDYLNSTVKAISEPSVNSYDLHYEDLIMTPGYLDPRTGEVDSTLTNYNYSQRVNVNPGDIVKAKRENHTSNSFFRAIAFYKNSVIVASAAIDANITAFIVPDGVDSFIATAPVAALLGSVEEIKKTSSDTKILHHVGHQVLKFDLDSGEKKELPFISVKNENVIMFNGIIDTLGSIELGKNTVITIDDTNITIGGNTIPHGLTIDHDLTVIIENDNYEYLKSITVSSMGEKFVYEPSETISFNTSDGNTHVTSTGTVMTDCVLSWTSRNMSKDIWIFGDSYVSLANTRWAYYLPENGFDKNCIIHGYAGEQTPWALLSFSNMLKTGTVPKTVIWALGMNDPDSDGQANPEWVYGYEALKKYSNEYGFELILATIPLVQPVDNSYKNAVVKASGYRYIDFAAAVNTTGTNWVSGALSGDGIHPTILGAKLLYDKAIASVPELCTK